MVKQELYFKLHSGLGKLNPDKKIRLKGRRVLTNLSILYNEQRNIKSYDGEQVRIGWRIFPPFEEVFYEPKFYCYCWFDDSNKTYSELCDTPQNLLNQINSWSIKELGEWVYEKINGHPMCCEYYNIWCYIDIRSRDYVIRAPLGGFIKTKTLYDLEKFWKKELENDDTINFFGRIKFTKQRSDEINYLLGWELDYKIVSRPKSWKDRTKCKHQWEKGKEKQSYYKKVAVRI